MTPIHITGVGIVCATGRGVSSFTDHLRHGRTGVRDLKLDRNVGNRVGIAATVPDDVPMGQGEPNAKLCDRFSLLALMAARDAIDQSGLERDYLHGSRTAVIIASGIGGMNTIDNNHYGYYALGRSTDPLAIPKIMPSAAASQVCMALGIKGPSFAISSACSSSTQAIGLALQLMRAGSFDRAIVGGSEALVTPTTMRSWETLRVLTPNLCKPFGADRNGMVIGEGAGVLVLETQESVQVRGAGIVGNVLGYGTTSDAGDLVKPDADGAAEAMRLALNDAALKPADIGYINAHGTGTILNDQVESAAINAVFGAGSGGIPVSSTKPIHGHCIGGAGAIEAIATLIAMNEGFAPATLNTTDIDPKCDVALVKGDSSDLAAEFGLSNNFAFGGINASLVLGRASE
ncbi:MAG: beta-ketoacyl synthase [Devosiaceae bacterium]